MTRVAAVLFDRDIQGRSIRVDLCGAPALVPVGAAEFAVRTGAIDLPGWRGLSFCADGTHTVPSDGRPASLRSRARISAAAARAGKSVSEYYADIDRALEEIGEPVLLAGHSTGGLVSSLYAADGARRESVRALWLNSPFFDWRLPDWRIAQLHLAAAVGRFFPFLKDESTLRADYVDRLLEDWEFDLRLKPRLGFPIYFGWLGAITDAHARVRRGLGLQIPVLSMHSDEGDIVLDWRDIAKWSRTLGGNVAVLGFPGGQHDLVLSRAPVREEVFRQLFAWAEPALALPA